MELIENVGAYLLSMISQVFAVIVENPIKFAIISTIVLGAAVIAGILDEGGRHVDNLIEDALEDEEDVR